MIEIQPLLDFILDIGNSLSNKHSVNVKSEKQKDIKLEIDVEFHRKITGYLTKTYGYRVLSEEGDDGMSYSDFDHYYWILDPLDGSFNYRRGIPFNCVSVSLWKNTDPVMGIIYDFNREDLFVSNENESFLNNEIIRTSHTDSAKVGILCTGFPSWRNYSEDSLLSFVNKVQRWKKIRAIGSAALSLTWVARGWADAYVEEDIRIWDVAAGLSLVQRAGGNIYVKENDRPNFVTAIATNGKISIGELL